MADPNMKTRPMGARAVLGRTGFPDITSDTGGTLKIATGVSEAGFNPVDLLYASLSSCLVLSARIAASKFGVLKELNEVRASVTGEKAADEPSRIIRFNISIEIDGDFDDEMKAKIAEAAENDICTVSNTIRGNPEFVTKLL